jgi:hypothetical protein
VQINDPRLRPTAGQEIAMAAPEHQGGDHAARASLSTAIDPGRDFREPGPLVAIVEWMGRAHLANVQRRVELVTFLQRPAEPLGERCCNCRLPAARDARDNEDWASAGDIGLFYR